MNDHYKSSLQGSYYTLNTVRVAAVALGYAAVACTTDHRAGLGAQSTDQNGASHPDSVAARAKKHFTEALDQNSEQWVNSGQPC